MRLCTQDRTILEEDWQTQSTDLTTVFLTWIHTQKFSQTQNQVRHMSHWNQYSSSPHDPGRPCQRLAQTIYQTYYITDEYH